MHPKESIHKEQLQIGVFNLIFINLTSRHKSFLHSRVVILTCFQFLKLNVLFILISTTKLVVFSSTETRFRCNVYILFFNNELHIITRACVCILFYIMFNLSLWFWYKIEEKSRADIEFEKRRIRQPITVNYFINWSTLEQTILLWQLSIFLKNYLLG